MHKGVNNLPIVIAHLNLQPLDRKFHALPIVSLGLNYECIMMLSECMTNFRMSVNFILSLQMMFWVQDSLELSMEVITEEVFCTVAGKCDYLC